MANSLTPGLTPLATFWVPGPTVFYYKSPDVKTLFIVPGTAPVPPATATLKVVSGVPAIEGTITYGWYPAQIQVVRTMPGITPETVFGVPAETDRSLFTSLAVTTSPSVPSISTTAPNVSVPATVSSMTVPFTTVPSTTTPSTSSTATGGTSPIRSARKGVSGGAVAGIAVGCLLVGALLAGFLSLIWLKRQKRHSNGYPGTVSFLQNEKYSNNSRNTEPQLLENYFPLPLEDRALTRDVDKLSTSIKNHVQSYYHSGRVSPGILDLDDIQALGHDLPISSGTLSTLLANSSTREMALRFAIAWVIVSRIQLPGDPQTTLLPPEISQSLCAMSRDPARQ